MILNDAGKMVERWYRALENKFANVKCDEYMIMPNHFHCIVQLVGADQRVCPIDQTNPNTDKNPDGDSPVSGKIPGDGLSVSGKIPDGGSPVFGKIPGGDSPISGKIPDGGSPVFGNKTTDGLFGLKGEHVGSPLPPPSSPSVVMGAALPRVLQWFKTMTTNEYIRNVKQNGWPRYDKKLWQRDYYEHIVRNDIELNRIRKYIRENPEKWERDRENRF